MRQDRILIHELAQLAGTTVRTIRYYTDEGLLPQPEYDGKYGYYSPMHLKRLELIHRLKEAYLPLREIRQIMLSIKDDADLERMIKQYKPDQDKGEAPISPQPAINKSSDALEYIKQLKERQGINKEQRSMTFYQSPPQVPQKERQEKVNYITNINDAQSGGETWQRISIIPGVELFLRQPAEPEINSRIQQLISFARKLFYKK